MHITFIGGGNMASAMIGGLLAQGWGAADLCVVEIAAPARERLGREFGVRALPALDTAAAAADCIVLAVKPQQLREAARALAPGLVAQLVVSIAAGIRSTDLSRWLGGYRRVVRVMPNTPALVRAGISGLYAPPEVGAGDRARAEGVLAAVGATVWVERERDLDAVTAVSGSGPAYVFYFIEALEQAARELGLPADTARRLALETFRGAARLALASPDPVATLRERVTSKGGTTERALKTMDSDGVGAAIARAVRAAAERSRELGDELGGTSD
ncbi:MAG: pyrroline-5-carboxylate reductase [Burkholderiales bacterium]|nr:pyrroline-5-carboxylate reductase [Burkholderiales bacterium]